MGKTKKSKTPPVNKCSCGGTHFISINLGPMFGDCSLSQEIDGKTTNFTLDEEESEEENESEEEIPDTFDNLGIHVSYSEMSVEVSMEICVGCRKVQP